MNYQGFARKYRPKIFSDAVGQTEIVTTLQNTITSNRIHHAYLFCGPRGVGKTSLARIFAKALNCEQGITITPCNECEICLRISSGEDVDVLEIDGASNRGIEEIRNIKENIKYLPTRSRFKIFIIDEIHMLTIQAFNALLKTLEEPPEHVKFIFATTQVHSIPDTILSRCQRFNFKSIEIKDIVARLVYISKAEKLDVEAEILEEIASHAGGAMRDSLVLLDQLASYGNGKISKTALNQISGNQSEQIQKIIDTVIAQKPSELLDTLQLFFKQGSDITNLIDKLIQHIRDILVVSVVGGTSQFVEGPDQYKKWVLEKSGQVTHEFLNLAIFHLAQAKNLINRTLLGKILLETVLLKLMHTDSLLSLKQIESNLVSLEKKISSRVGNANFTNIPEKTIPSSVIIGLGESKNLETRNVDSFNQPQSILEKKNVQNIGQPKAKLRNVQGMKPLPQNLKNEPIQGIDKTQLNLKKENTKSFRSTQPNFEKKNIQNISSQVNLAKKSEHQKVQPETNSGSPWDNFLKDLSKKAKQISTFLKNKSKHSVSNGKLNIYIPYEHQFIANMILHPKNKAWVTELVTKNFGQSLSVNFDFEGQNRSQEQSEIKSKLDSDPVVCRALELFAGRIVQVGNVE